MQWARVPEAPIHKQRHPSFPEHKVRAHPHRRLALLHLSAHPHVPPPPRDSKPPKHANHPQLRARVPARPNPGHPLRPLCHRQEVRHRAPVATAPSPASLAGRARRRQPTRGTSMNSGKRGPRTEERGAGSGRLDVFGRGCDRTTPSSPISSGTGRCDEGRRRGRCRRTPPGRPREAPCRAGRASR